MNDKPPIVIGQLTAEEEAARNARKNAEFDELRSRYGIIKDETALIPFQNAVKGSRTAWATAAMHEICDVAQKQLLAYKDGSVEIPIGGENLRVRVGKVAKRDEFQLWIAEPSLLALDRLLIAKREEYRKDNTPNDEAYTPDTSSALTPEMIRRGENTPDRITTFATTTPARQAHSKSVARFPTPMVSPRALEEQKVAIFFERDTIREELTRVLAEKMKNPANQGSEAFSTVDDFKLLIDTALKDVPQPSSKNKNSQVDDFDKPFGLEQMQLFRANIKSRINGSPRASAGLTVLIQAIDETMQQFWNERPLVVRPTNEASQGR